VLDYSGSAVMGIAGRSGPGRNARSAHRDAERRFTSFAASSLDFRVYAIRSAYCGSV
jgi:hypothetical protein